MRHRPPKGLSQALFLLAAPFPVWAAGGNRGLFGGSDVVEFVPNTFNSTVFSDPRVWVVLYYADWCGHCQHFAPIYKRMATKLVPEQSKARLGALNCAAHNSFCSGIDVRGYPTVRCYHISGMKESWEKKGAQVPGEVFRSESELPKWVIQRLPTTSTIPPPVIPAAPQSSEAPPAAAAADGAATSAPAAASPKTEPPAAPLLNAPQAAASAAGKSLSISSSTKGPPVKPGSETPMQRLVDAEVALLYSLRQGTFLAAIHKPGQPPQLEGAALAELRAWLEFLAMLLPDRKASKDIGELAAIVAEAQDSSSGALLEDAWTKALEGRSLGRALPQAGKDPAPYWRTCRTYTCGLWSLFHIITVAAAEHRTHLPVQGFLSPPSPDLNMPERALTRIRGFVAHFFGCQECSTNFLQTYDSCGLDRCKLDPTDGEAAALWLWQVHNSVAKRVSLEGGAAQPVPAWPARSACGSCWTSEGEDHWDSKTMFSHMKAAYWLPEWTVTPKGPAASPDFALAGGLLTLAALGYFLWHFFSSGGAVRREKGS